MTTSAIQTTENTFSLTIEQIKSLAFLEPGNALSAIEKLEHAGTQELSINALYELYLVKAHTYLQLSNFHEATKCINICLEHALLNELPSLQLQALNYKSQIEFFQNKYEQVIRTSSEALLLGRELENYKEQASAYNSIGIAYGTLYAYEQSLEALLAGLALSEHLDDALLNKLNNNASNVYYYLGHYDHALKTLQTAVSYVDIEKNPRTHILSTSNFGKIHAKLENIDEATNYLEKARNLAENESTHVDLLPNVYHDLAEFYIQEHHYDEASNILDKALRLVQKDKNISDEISLKVSKANCYIGSQKYNEAIDILNSALLLKNTTTPTKTLLELHKAFSETYENLSDYQKALEHYKRFHNLKEEIHDEHSQARMQGMMIKHYTERLQSEHDRLANEKELASLRLLKLEQDNLKLIQENTRDGLTGAYNRRYLNEKFSEVFELATKNQSPLSVMMSDIDFFKQVNDTYSHAIGDEVLRAIARIFMDNTREQDTVARYGGEEFVVIFDRTHKSTAITVAEKLRILIQDYPWHEIHPELKITISIGVSSGLDYPDYEAMLNHADKYMYTAKRSGKNQVQYE